MDNPLTRGFRNLRYSFVAQAVILLVGLAKTLIVPLVLSVDSYAYWQLYLFYVGYVGFFYLGFNDGILLKYGAFEYEDLPFERLRRSMQFYIIMLTLFALGVFAFSMTIGDAEKAFVFHMVALCIVIYGLNGVFIYVFLITNQIKRHSIFSAVDSVSSFFGILLLLVMNQSDFHVLVYFVFTVKLLSVAVMAVMCRKLFVGKRSPIQDGLREFVDNIRVGIFLMFAQIMGMLVTGLGRIFVEYGGELSDYAYYAFGTTVLGIVMVGVTAVATVMYPTLGRLETEMLPKIFNKIYDFFSHFTVLVLILYYPAYALVGICFQKYQPMLVFFSILFVLVTWQAKVSITTNTYFRVLRMEKKMFKVNFLSVLFFCIIYLVIDTTVGRFLANKTMVVALSTLLSMMFLELLAELVLRRTLKLKLGNSFAKDTCINAVFLLTALIPDKIIGFLTYSVFVAIYLVVCRKALIHDFRDVLGGLAKG